MLISISVDLNNFNFLFSPMFLLFFLIFHKLDRALFSEYYSQFVYFFINNQNFVCVILTILFLSYWIYLDYLNYSNASPAHSFYFRFSIAIFLSILLGIFLTVAIEYFFNDEFILDLCFTCNLTILSVYFVCYFNFNDLNFLEENVGNFWFSVITIVLLIFFFFFLLILSFFFS